MRAVDAVTDVGEIGQRLETMQEARGNIEVPMEVVVQPKLGCATVCRGVRPAVNNDIVDRAASATYELCLATSEPTVQAADYAMSRTGLRVLHERRGVDAMRCCDLGVKRAREEPALVLMGCWHEDQDAGKSGQPNFHRAMVPPC